MDLAIQGGMKIHEVAKGEDLLWITLYGKIDGDTWRCETRVKPPHAAACRRPLGEGRRLHGKRKKNEYRKEDRIVSIEPANPLKHSWYLATR